MNIKEIAEQLDQEQFEQLVAHYCVKEAADTFSDQESWPCNDEGEVTPPKYEDYVELAGYIFYEGMNREPGVADKISRLLLSPDFAYLFEKE